MKLKNLNKPLEKTELCELGFKHKTDKPGNGYTRVYYEIMKNKREDLINMFEIGIYFGASIKMWHEFFPNGRIFGIDNGRLLPGSKILVGGMDGTKINILSADDVKLLQPETVVENYPSFSWINNDRITCLVVDQRSERQLKAAFETWKCDKFDYILDDGQHWQEHQQKSLAILFPYINSGGYYIIEDVVPREMLLEGSFWGQKKKDCTDSTDYIIMKYLESGKLESRYMKPEQTKYIEDNIDDIFLFDNMNKNNSPINGSSKLLVIRKK
jgi:hypothetical protein